MTDSDVEDNLPPVWIRAGGVIEYHWKGKSLWIAEYAKEFLGPLHVPPVALNGVTRHALDIAGWVYIWGKIRYYWPEPYLPHEFLTIRIIVEHSLFLG